YSAADRPPSRHTITPASARIVHTTAVVQHGHPDRVVGPLRVDSDANLDLPGGGLEGVINQFGNSTLGTLVAGIPGGQNKRFQSNNRRFACLPHNSCLCRHFSLLTVKFSLTRMAH